MWRTRIAFAALPFVRPASGREFYRDELPNGRNVPGGASIGHQSLSGGGARSGFGYDFVKAGKAWTPWLCAQDSDGDGIPNGVELGDPSCVWEKGRAPTSTSAITDPSVRDGDGGSGKSASTPGNATWILVHGLLMLVSWILLVPFGVLSAMRRKSVGSDWLGIHKVANSAATGFSAIGAVIAISSVRLHGNTLHGIFGFVVFGLSVPMAVSGLLRPASTAEPARATPQDGAASKSRTDSDGALPSPTTTAAVESGDAPPAVRKSAHRLAWEILHKNVGRALTLLAIATVVLGIILSLGL
jgi:hypothetical protein